ncbi:uncharacterized protein LOC143565074 [Bidens hawaiensis]|uniref:uncharacterized protein LOC143565074 n=1 Tax=Bidens hawaiensis TaxID=980011 RepID=UPI00404AC5D3
MDQRVQEHDLALIRLESATTKNTDNLASMKVQMENQMNEILKSIQALGNNQNNNNHHNADGGISSTSSPQYFPYHNSNNRLTKIEFPRFCGENLEGWLCRVEHFFEIDATTGNLKVRYAIVHLDDTALLWHQSFVKSRGGSVEGMPWSEYKEAIVARFEFDLALTRVNICDEYAVSLFLRAIKSEIGNPVKLLRPRNLPEAYMLARVQNDNNMSSIHSSKFFKPSYASFVPKITDYGNRGMGGINNSLLPTPLLKPKPLNSRRLSHKEIEEKRAKVDMEDDYNTLVEPMMQTVQDPCISLNAIMGVPSYSTMRVQGAIGTKPLQILIDSGSTHTFLNLDLAVKMLCPIKKVAELNITVADGNKLSCTQLCENFKWMMQGNWFTTDVMLIPLISYDMVLGVRWLQILNDINWNFKQLTMKFKVGDWFFELKGIGSNFMTLCSAEKMNSLLGNSREIATAQLFSLQTVDTNSFQHETVVSKASPNEALSHLFDKRAYRYPAHQKNIIEKLTQELLDAGTIRNSHSAFASPVVLVKKKDGTWRFCVDYRKLNEATVKDRYPIPLIEELLDELGNATVFSKLDLRAGYHQVRMNEQDIHKTAFRTHQGLFEFVVMPFGLTNAPVTFQSMMNATFKSLMRKTTLVFFDDILVYSPTMEQHLIDLEQVLILLRRDTLFAKKSKCSFAGANVEYLGHIISGQGVQMDPKKIIAIQQWPVPTNLKHLKGFLGLAGYYIRFIKSFGVIARPLNDLMKKDNFSWTKDAATAFELLKAALVSAPVLALPDFSKPFVVETDASSKGLGAVLMQHNHPIAFISKALSTKQQALSAKYELVANPGLLQPLPVPTHVFTDVSMDFISGLPKVQGKDTVLVVIDRLTKYAHFMPLSHPYTASQVAHVFIDNVLKLHGCPITIVSDRDPIFLSAFWKEFMRLQGVQLAYSTAYHP